MIMLMKKSPSKRLKEKIHACVSSFQKLGTAVKEALEQGRDEGFSDKEIGKMIREEMLQAGFDRSTVASYLPSSAKLKPRGKPGSGYKISRKNLQTEAVEYQMLEQEQIQKSDVLAEDDFEEQKMQTDEDNNSPTPEARIVNVQSVASSVGNIGVQAAAAVELGTEVDEYDIEQLEKYSRGTLERIIKWQHERLKEDHNEGTSCKSKYKSLKLAYKKATGKDWVD